MLIVASSSYEISTRSKTVKIRGNNTFMITSEYLSFCWRSNELVEPTMYDLVPKSASISNCCKGVYGPK